MSGSENTPAEDPIRGILLTLSATILFTVSDTLAKFLSTELPVVQISWIRYVIFVGFAAALFGIASALCWSTGLVITRKIANTERASTTLLWSAGVGLLILTVLLPFNYAWPTLPQFALALTLGCCASGGQWMVVLAHRQAPASVLAPFTYIQLPWSVLAGYLVFSAIPDRWMLLGAAIIIASGLYTAHRERVQAAARRLPH